ncbi:sugar phosphate isomerase/epimerase family protein [Streptomyces sp. SP18CS02]|uniref:sugar phosphate isomerase/epimerase family protein n=1 Tax=Streptomyces sp. SP18CS02 TaxID=3002531 RepID=UPI002E79C3E3|nr:sugar phosphate isomerase/epimerase family protein [Streptomyces sp. SP18CS02]MEE1753714.1 sugar phosphate isomerase/epimerase [Streptomyces sp. SP18CS02]
MKYAFSTLGVPGMPIADVARLAAGTGYQGVELRAHPEEPVHAGLLAHERRAVAEEFARAGVEILTVAGYADVAAAGDDEPVYEELYQLLHLAADLGASYVRVFPGGGDQDPEEADATAARRLGVAAEIAADLGVRILLETHDSHRTGADVARVVGLVGHKSVGALWDVMHPWLAGEDPAATHGVLAPYLGYVQVKDIASADDRTPLPLGHGALPLAECLALAVGGGDGTDAVRGLDTPADDAQGWVCWEYEKRWYPQAAALPPLLVAGREHLSRMF